jgi:putative flippase GtrA
MTQSSTAPPVAGAAAVKPARRFGRLSKFASHIPPGQFLRYILVGIWNTVLGYGLYALLTMLLMPRFRFGYLYAAVLSGALSITVAYFGYKFFVFKTRGRYLAEWLRCVIVYGTAMLPGLVLLPLLVEGLHLFFHLQRSAPYAGGALMTGFTAIYSFLGHKHFTFRGPGGAGGFPVDSSDAEDEIQSDSSQKKA